MGEISDLIYHLTVMMAQQNIPLEAVLEELDLPQSQDRESEAVSCCRSQHLTDQKERSCFYEL